MYRGRRGEQQAGGAHRAITQQIRSCFINYKNYSTIGLGMPVIQ
jgi:hypothetical protein